MIVNASLHHGHPRTAQAFALLLAAAVLPLGLAIAADDAQVERYRAVETRLQAAVDAGEMTQDQAQERLAGLHQRQVGNEVRLRSIEERINAAVETGELTEEEAAAKRQAVRRRLAGGASGDEARARYAAAVGRVRAAVQAGDITAEEGRKKLAAFRERMGRRSEQRDPP